MRTPDTFDTTIPSLPPHETLLEKTLWPLFEHAPHFLETALWCARPLATCLSSWRLPATRLRPASGDGATILAVGLAPSIERLLQPHLGQEPQREELGAIPLPALRHMLRSPAAGADLSLVRLPRLLAGWFLGAPALRVPEAVGTHLLIPAGEPLRPTGGSARKNLRAVERQGLTWRASHRRDDFERFFRDFYVPFVTSRHGNAGFLRHRRHLRRRFRRGALLWIEKEGRCIAGSLVEERGSALRSVAVGTLGGRVDLLEKGALSATYVFEVEYAQERGLSTLELGGCLPSLRDGLLRHKRSWGAALALDPEIQRDIVVRWETLNDRVARFLADVPLVFRDGDGLSAVTAAPHAVPAPVSAALGLRKELALPGIDRLYVTSPTGWEKADPANPVTDAGPELVFVESAGLEELRRPRRRKLRAEG